MRRHTSFLNKLNWNSQGWTHLKRKSPRCTWTNNNNNKRLVDRVTLEILGCCVLISWCLSSGSVNDYCLLNGTTGMELSNIIVTQLYREIDEVGQVYGGRICSWCVWRGKESAKIKEPFLNWNPECHVSCGLALPLPPTPSLILGV